ncbi:MAG: hypothetical protein R3F39_00240 [Myxococcota bacterium]
MMVSVAALATRCRAAWPVAMAMVVATTVACGGVKTATRAESPHVPVESFLVELVSSMPAEPISIQSLSVLDVNFHDPFPEAPDEGTVERMRRAAGGQGAQVLFIESVTTPSRHAYYGFGLRREAGGISPRSVVECGHAAAMKAMEVARKEASACLAALRLARPGAAGAVKLIFQVDAFGQVYRIAPSPDSSRDSGVQQCGLDAVSARDFGDHEDFLCRLDLEVAF